MNKRIRSTALVLLALIILFPCISFSKVSAAGIPSSNIYKAQTHFIKTNAFKKGQEIYTLSYDINNDGKDEIVLGAWNNQTADSKSAIAVYNRQGSLLSNMPIQGSKWLFNLHRLKDKTHKNTLAAEYVGDMSRSSYVEIFVWKNGKLHSIFETNGLGHNLVYRDTDKDGNDEIIGTQTYSAAETDRMGWNWQPLDKSVYVWSPQKGKYMHYTYGQDGIRDDLRKPVGTIDKKGAVSLVNQAYQKLWTAERYSSESFTKKMQFLFTYNLIISFTGSSEEIRSEEIELGTMNVSQAAFSISKDKQSASVKQTYPVYDEDGKKQISSMKLVVGLLRTKYGWKIDSLTVE